MIEEVSAGTGKVELCIWLLSESRNCRALGQNRRVSRVDIIAQGIEGSSRLIVSHWNQVVIECSKWYWWSIQIQFWTFL
jgi:hypothetical protein